jgi:quercetin dioxygenase-like cupin family protein
MTRMLAVITLFTSLSLAEEAAPAAHTMLAPADLKWVDGPPTLPPGAKMTVLAGDPAKTGMFVLRVKFPAGYKIPAHWHPTDETVTVISGSVAMGMGDKLDAKEAKPLVTGAFANMPAKTNHYLIAKAAAVVQVAAMGPFAITYVNADDDPRKGAAPAAAPAKK